ncbi:MAG: hypothetical protein RIF39_03485 [Cyclobacteriaceae bacterium]
MKLLKAQYQDILQVLEEQKIPIEKLSLVKIKGRIRVLVAGVDSHFEFFRRKSVAITQEKHQWEHVEHYELNILGVRKNVSVWPEVVLALELWLKSTRNAS